MYQDERIVAGQLSTPLKLKYTCVATPFSQRSRNLGTVLQSSPMHPASQTNPTRPEKAQPQSAIHTPIASQANPLTRSAPYLHPPSPPASLFQTSHQNPVPPASSDEGRKEKRKENPRRGCKHNQPKPVTQSATHPQAKARLCTTYPCVSSNLISRRHPMIAI